jgi:hypothetical protein
MKMKRTSGMRGARRDNLLGPEGGKAVAVALAHLTSLMKLDVRYTCDQEPATCLSPIIWQDRIRPMSFYLSKWDRRSIAL